MNNDILSSGLPMGFSMALAQNPESLQAYTAMSDEEKRSVLNGLSGIGSKAQMRAYVESLHTGFLG